MLPGNTTSSKDYYNKNQFNYYKLCRKHFHNYYYYYYYWNTTFCHRYSFLNQLLLFATFNLWLKIDGLWLRLIVLEIVFLVGTFRSIYVNVVLVIQYQQPILLYPTVKRSRDSLHFFVRTSTCSHRASIQNLLLRVKSVTNSFYSFQKKVGLLVCKHYFAAFKLLMMFNRSRLLLSLYCLGMHDDRR